MQIVGVVEFWEHSNFQDMDMGVSMDVSMDVSVSMDESLDMGMDVNMKKMFIH
jgi:hypothetical protein